MRWYALVGWSVCSTQSAIGDTTRPTAVGTDKLLVAAGSVTGHVEVGGRVAAVDGIVWSV
jgi:hypothetical protein